MADDLDRAPDPAPRRPKPDDFDALSAPRRRSVDDHMFSVRTPSGLPATCRLQLFTAAGVRPVAVVTQVAGEGMGLTNAAEAFAGAVWERHCPTEELPPVWVQRQLWAEGSSRPARFQRVVFAEAERYRPRRPRWSTITSEQLAVLVGAEVAADRGAGYVPRPQEPEPQMRFEEFAVIRLARPQPFRAPSCMPAGMGWWRRWARQVLPRRKTAAPDCCWYHGGDWHAVSAMALQVLQRARAQGVAVEDMEEYAVAHATAAGAGQWQAEALATLFSTTDAIQPDSGGTGYINGQHRAQALLEAGVRRTVVLRTVPAP